jgi:hypothetical protein
MKTPSARIRTIAAFAAAPVAVLIAGGIVWQGSLAAFTATTRTAMAGSPLRGSIGPRQRRLNRGDHSRGWHV